MAVALSTLVEEADRYLTSAKIADYCPNGLQVEGRPQVMRIVSGVTASQALLDAAVEAEADLVLVHHGYFWKGENPCVTSFEDVAQARHQPARLSLAAGSAPGCRQQRAAGASAGHHC